MNNKNIPKRTEDLCIRNFDLITADAYRITPDASIEELLKIISQDKNPGVVYVVTDDGKLLGYVSMSDAFVEFAPLCGAVNSDELMPAAAFQNHLRRVSDIMQVIPQAVNKDTSIRSLAEIVLRQGREEIPLVDYENRFRGVVRVRRLIHQYLSRKESLLASCA